MMRGWDIRLFSGVMTKEKRSQSKEKRSESDGQCRLMVMMMTENRCWEEEHTYQYLFLLFFLCPCLHHVLSGLLLHPLPLSTVLFTKIMSRLFNSLSVVKIPICSPVALANCEAFTSSSTIQKPSATLTVYWQGLFDVKVRQVSGIKY